MNALSRWWFVEVPAKRLAAVRIAVGAYGLDDLTEGYSQYARIARRRRSSGGRSAPCVSFARPLDPSAFDVWQAVHWALALCFLIGFGWRVLAPLCAVSGIFFYAYRTSWGSTYHADNLFVSTCSVWRSGPAASAWSVDAAIARRWPDRLRWLRSAPLPDVDWRFGWTLRLTATVTVITYLLAGTAKLATNASGWLTARTSSRRSARTRSTRPSSRRRRSRTRSCPGSTSIPSHAGPLAPHARGRVRRAAALVDRGSGWLWSFGALVHAPRDPAHHGESRSTTR
jgi:hypothetical protein